MVEVAETLEAKLKRHEDALVACMAEIEKLRAENALLRSAEGAHDVLRRIYLNESESSNARIKAAQASINFEKSRLENVPPPLNLVAEQHESLADIVTRQRARADAMQPKLIEQTIKDNEAAARAWRNGGNGRDDNTGS
jgi:hypothetical protein